MCMWGATRLEASRENKEPEGGVGELEAVTSTRASETRERETSPSQKTATIATKKRGTAPAW